MGIDEGKTFNKNNFKPFRCKNKFCSAYNKQIYIWRETISEDLKISKFKFLRTLKL